MTAYFGWPWNPQALGTAKRPLLVWQGQWDADHSKCFLSVFLNLNVHHSAWKCCVIMSAYHRSPSGQLTVGRVLCTLTTETKEGLHHRSRPNLGVLQAVLVRQQFPEVHDRVHANVQLHVSPHGPVVRGGHPDPLIADRG